ncbi:glycosyl transferase [Blastomyces gilchristii SLH14081]|uniref:Glycosyl transferase n=1 Tax=Blastomyces gilchristii (strain SLH14081) TaxID=559298 RepID=A0A179UNF9_BLAGS|nr:glycosyl transferase [Blastomyces gilchristii SLH14081]OAT07952.1 glycosyl transferase [Blastomyces gilchristii SLH14081]
MVIDDILNEIKATKEKYNLTSTSELQLGMVDDVVDYTGSRRLTAGVLRSLSEQLGEMVDSRNVSRLPEPEIDRGCLDFAAVRFCPFSQQL